MRRHSTAFPLALATALVLALATITPLAAAAAERAAAPELTDPPAGPAATDVGLVYARAGPLHVVCYSSVRVCAAEVWSSHGVRALGPATSGTGNLEVYRDSLGQPAYATSCQWFPLEGGGCENYLTGITFAYGTCILVVATTASTLGAAADEPLPFCAPS